MHSLYDLLEKVIISRETFRELITNLNVEPEHEENRNPKYDIYPYGVDDLVLINDIYQKL